MCPIQCSLCCSPNVEIIPDNPQHEAYMGDLVKKLIQEIENKASVVASNDFVSKIRLGEAAKMFKQRYE